MRMVLDDQEEMQSRSPCTDGRQMTKLVEQRQYGKQMEIWKIVHCEQVKTWVMGDRHMRRWTDKKKLAKERGVTRWTILEFERVARGRSLVHR